MNVFRGYIYLSFSCSHCTWTTLLCMDYNCWRLYQDLNVTYYSV